MGRHLHCGSILTPATLLPWAPHIAAVLILTCASRPQEVGFQVLHGGQLSSCASDDNPARQAYIDFLGPHRDRYSWDPLALLVAVRGVEAVPGLAASAAGRALVYDDCSNAWASDVGGSQRHILVSEPWMAKAAGAAIDKLICQVLAADPPPPNTRPRPHTLAQRTPPIGGLCTTSSPRLYTVRGTEPLRSAADAALALPAASNADGATAVP